MIDYIKMYESMSASHETKSVENRRVVYTTG